VDFELDGPQQSPIENYRYFRGFPKEYFLPYQIRSIFVRRKKTCS
jgi:hypothetical protein